MAAPWNTPQTTGYKRSQPAHQQGQRQPQGQSPLTGHIVQIASDGKFISFSGKLRTPDPLNADSLHGGYGTASVSKNGRKVKAERAHSVFPSRIGVQFTDYGNNPTYCMEWNLTVEECYRIYEVTKQHLTIFQNAYLPKDAVETLCGCVDTLRVMYSKEPTQDEITSLGKRLRGVVDSITREELVVDKRRFSIGAPREDGRVKAKTLVVKYQPVYGGKVQDWPWYFELEDGTALPESNGNGRQNTKSGSFVPKPGQPAVGRFKCRNNDLHRAMLRVVRYIETWETTKAAQVLLQSPKYK